MFKKGDIIRRITKDGSGEIVRVLTTNSNGDVVTRIATGNDDGEDWVDFNDYEFVTDSQEEQTPEFPTMPPEQHVAIVSFEGAINREIKAIREGLRQTDLTSFKFEIEAAGRVEDGEIKVEYSIREGEYGDKIKGSNIRECLNEMLRRHGWKKHNAPKAISYNSVPS